MKYMLRFVFYADRDDEHLKLGPHTLIEIR